jgi:hypothetical protein
MVWRPSARARSVRPHRTSAPNLTGGEYRRLPCGRARMPRQVAPAATSVVRPGPIWPPGGGGTTTPSKRMPCLHLARPEFNGAAVLLRQTTRKAGPSRRLKYGAIVGLFSGVGWVTVASSVKPIATRPNSGCVMAAIVARRRPAAIRLRAGVLRIPALSASNSWRSRLGTPPSCTRRTDHPKPAVTDVSRSVHSGEVADWSQRDCHRPPHTAGCTASTIRGCPARNDDHPTAR